MYSCYASTPTVDGYLPHCASNKERNIYFQYLIFQILCLVKNCGFLRFWLLWSKYLKKLGSLCEIFLKPITLNFFSYYYSDPGLLGQDLDPSFFIGAGSEPSQSQPGSELHWKLLSDVTSRYVFLCVRAALTRGFQNK